MREIQHFKRMLIPLLFYFIFPPFSSTNFAFAQGNDIRYEKIGVDKRGVSGLEYDIDDRIPEAGEHISYLNYIVIDLVIPGGGHFFRNNRFLGFAFAVLKVVGAFSIYYYYMDVRDRRSLYYSSMRRYEVVNVEYSLDPQQQEEMYKTVQGYKRDYDRALQHVSFSVFGNIAIYLSSLLITYLNIKKMNENSLPTFELLFSYNIISHCEGDVFNFKFNYRI